MHLYIRQAAFCCSFGGSFEWTAGELSKNKSMHPRLLFQAFAEVIYILLAAKVDLVELQTGPFARKRASAALARRLQLTNVLAVQCCRVGAQVSQVSFTSGAA